MLFQDYHEAVQLEALIKPCVDAFVQADLNGKGWADWKWFMHNGEPEHAEHKTVTEILSGFEHVEYQLAQEREKCSNLHLIQEGIVEPDPRSTGCKTFFMAPNATHFKPGRAYPHTPYARYVAWIIGLRRAGVEVHVCNSWVSVAHTVIALYQSAQRPETTVLNRYLKQKVFHKNKYVQTLMGVADGGIGPTTAEKLLKVFDTPSRIFNEKPQYMADMVPGFGLTKAKKLLRAIGRPDV